MAILSRKPAKPDSKSEKPAPAGTGGRVQRVLGAPRWALALVVLAIFALLYWGLLGWLLHDTTADLALRPDPADLPPGGSVTVAYLVTLTEAEVSRGGWTPNDSFLSPTAALDEMPAFQSGVHDVLAAAARAYAEESANDDLAEAAEDYAVPVTRGFFHANFPFIGGSAGARYKDGARTFRDFNAELADSERMRLTEPRQAASLMEAMAASMEETMSEIDRSIRSGESDHSPALLHARARGEAYAATLLLRGIRADFEPDLRDRQLGSTMVAAIEQFDRVASESPFSIGQSDVTNQGYFLRSGLEAMARMEARLR